MTDTTYGRYYEAVFTVNAGKANRLYSGIL